MTLLVNSIRLLVLLEITKVETLRYRIRRQTEGFNVGGLPRHLPSPPKHEPGDVPAVANQVPPPTSTEGSPPAQPPAQPSDPPGQGTGPIPPPGMNFMANTVTQEGGFYYPPFYYENAGPSTGTPVPESATETTSSDDAETDYEEEEEETDPAPFGLDDTILILVPQFKYTIHGFPNWTGASVRMSLPITGRDSFYIRTTFS